MVKTATDLLNALDKESLQSNHKILLVLPSFSCTEVSCSGLYLAKTLFSLYNVYPVIMATHDGVMREKFDQENFFTVIEPLLFNNEQLSLASNEFILSFEKVIVISLASFAFIEMFKNRVKNLVWWIHETDTAFKEIIEKTDISELFVACNAVWLANPLCFPLVQQYLSQDKLRLLMAGHPDVAMQHQPDQSGKLIFSIFTAHHKDQTLFIDAIGCLPRNIVNKAIFRIIGSVSDGDNAIFYLQARTKAALIPQINYFEPVSWNKQLRFYAETDIVIGHAQDDTLPITVTTGLMFSKVCLCASNIGHVQLLEDNKNALLFANESVEQLLAKIAWILENPTALAAIGSAGRAVYDQYFSMESFCKNVKKLTQDIELR